MTPLPRTPKPLPAGVRRMRQDNPLPMTASQYLRWSRRRRPSPKLGAPSKDWMDKQFAHTNGRPQHGDAVEATESTHSGDEAAWLDMVRSGGMVAGDDVPLAVAWRLHDLGLIRKAVNTKDE